MLSTVFPEHTGMLRLGDISGITPKFAEFCEIVACWAC